ncbi:MAG: c-type cytochrome [Phycisphaerales bacterium]|nr:c-type cytochrome [Phycisphaerales bacterium]
MSPTPQTTSRSRTALPDACPAVRATHPDPYRWSSLGFMTVLGMTLPVVITMIAMTAGGPGEGGRGAGGDGPDDDAGRVAAGARVYQTSCTVCHGPNADGVPMLGKPLRNSGFVQTQTDESLFALVAEGRAPTDPANTTGVLMPPRGAQGLSDDQIRGVVSYLRSIQDPGAPLASVAPWERSPGEGGGPPVTAIRLTDHPGYDLFVSSCTACHGAGAEGMEGLGLPLTTSGFVRGKSDGELIDFIKSGRPSWDGGNTTGIDMPPKGGNPAITDEQLQSIVAYIRALQEAAMGS